MELPLFPLHLVLFPGRPLPLHVFELRYRQMLADCLRADRRFGVVAIKAGSDVGRPADVFRVGTIAEIEHVERFDDGRARIATRGVQRFRIDAIVPGRPYLCGRVRPLEEAPAVAADTERAQLLRRVLLPYLAELGAPDELLRRIPSHPTELAWLAAAALQVEVPEQQRLLELDSCGQRLEATLEALRREAGLMRHFGTVGSLRPPGPAGADLN